MQNPEAKDHLMIQVLHLKAAVWNTKLLMKRGSTNYLEVLTAQQTLLQAELTEASDKFDEMQSVADNNYAIMTVYVDDVTFSSEYRLSHKFKEQILSIVRKYGYQISRPKVKYYTKLYPKLVTGVVIDSSGSPIIKNAMREKIINEHRHLREFPDDKSSRQRLCGLLTAARQVDPHAFPTIYKFAFSSPDHE